MTVAVYKCDACNRTIEVARNIHGLDVVGRCIITDKCKGYLQQQGIKETAVGTPPVAVDGLNDWVQRRVLFTHDQTTSNQTWSVIHNLNSVPAIQVFLSRDAESGAELYETTEYAIENITANSFDVVFSDTVQGVCQCIARNSAFTNTQAFVEDSTTSLINTLTQITTNLEITIATEATLADLPALNLTLNFMSPANLTDRDAIDPIEFTGIRNIPTSPWSPYNFCTIKGKLYTLRSALFNISDVINSNVENGDPVFFTVDGAPTEAESVYLLLSHYPYERIDKNYDQLIDISKFVRNNAATAIIYQDGNLYAFNSVVQTVFPPIRLQFVS